MILRKAILALAGLGVAGAVLVNPVVDHSPPSESPHTVQEAHDAVHAGPQDAAAAHSGVRFCLTSSSQSGTRVYWHGPDGATQSSFINPGGCIVYPTGGHLISARIAYGWSLDGQQNGSPYQNVGTVSPYEYAPIYGSLNVRYWDI